MDYYKEMDILGFKKLQTLNDDEHLFTSLEYTPQMCRFDAFATDQLDNDYAIEIKIRNIPSTKFDTIALDTTKYRYLYLLGLSGYIPLFISFFSDGVCLIWKITEDLPTEDKEITIYNPGLCEYQTKSLTYLSVKDAIKRFTYKV